MDKHIIDKLNSSKKILVTGGAGFIGGAVIRKLLRSSTAKIFNLDKLGYASDLTSIKKTLKELGEEASDRYFFYQVDLCNKNSTRNIVQQISPDIIMHLAAESHVDRSIEGPEIFLKSNIMGTYNLLTAAFDHYSSFL